MCQWRYHTIQGTLENTAEKVTHIELQQSGLQELWNSYLTGILPSFLFERT